jgi:hypothetical protein
VSYPSLFPTILLSFAGKNYSEVGNPAHDNYIVYSSDVLSNPLLTILIFQVKSLPPLHIYVIDKALDGKYL